MFKSTLTTSSPHGLRTPGPQPRTLGHHPHMSCAPSRLRVARSSRLSTAASAIAIERTSPSPSTYLRQVLATKHVPGTSLDRKGRKDSQTRSVPPPDGHLPPRTATRKRRPPSRLRAPEPRLGGAVPAQDGSVLSCGPGQALGREEGHRQGPPSGCRPPRLASPRPAAPTAPSPRGPHTPSLRGPVVPRPPGKDPQQGCPAERPKDPAGAAQGSYRGAWWPGSAVEDQVNPDQNSRWAGARTALNLGCA
ncbi:basic proline-rich protein-like [Eumetopias jubatus]|uniref:basic proline-rich protein-like n=1 Tax=Eumetopias jubatus TaxID=34886 RepID=UPI001015CC75|nr:basic proline-rich protein-like [Eumetopias jubatus]